MQYSKEITIGISNYDNINPILTNNKEIINISKLVFEPLISLGEEYKKELVLQKNVQNKFKIISNKDK